MTEQARAEFHTWWECQPYKALFEEFKPQMANVWVASRAECVVVIDLDEWPSSIAHAIRTAIEATGLKVQRPQNSIQSTEEA